jgi:hypothetical protein
LAKKKNMHIETFLTAPYGMIKYIDDNGNVVCEADKKNQLNFEIKEDVIIYSIVDSLTELDTINTVQIAVNGKTDITYRDKMSLGEYYKKNLDLVIEDGDDVEVVQKQEKEGLLDTGE